MKKRRDLNLLKLSDIDPVMLLGVLDVNKRRIEAISAEIEQLENQVTELRAEAQALKAQFLSDEAAYVLYASGHKMDEIAEMLAISKSTASSRINRFIWRKLNGRYVEPGVVTRETELRHTNLHVRTWNPLSRANIKTAGELLDFYREHGVAGLRTINNIGKVSIREIESFIESEFPESERAS
jgi:hypothetical protein